MADKTPKRGRPPLPSNLKKPPDTVRSIRFPGDLWAEINRHAEAECRSASMQVIYLVRKALEDETPKKGGK